MTNPNTTGNGISAVTMTLSGSSSGTTQTNSSGNYSFTALNPGGSYTVTPSKANYIFTPPGQTFNNLSADQIADFAGIQWYTISGRITDASSTGIGGVSVVANGSDSASALTDTNGDYSFPLPAGGNYWITPSKDSYGFTPRNRLFNNLSANQTGNFTTKVLTYPIPLSLVGQDIGSVGVAGSTALDSGIYTVRGSGVDIAGTADSFHYASQELIGDGQIIARITGVQNTNSGAKAGLMIRETPTGNSKHVSVVLSPSGGLSFVRRTSTGGSTSSTAGNTVVFPRWLLLLRKGTEIAAYSSTDGANWTYVNSVTITLAATVRVGLAVTSKNNTVLNTSTFDNVSLMGGPPNHPPQVSISSPGTGTTHNSSPGITINATASDRDGASTIAKVEFYADGALIGTDTSSSYSYLWTNPTPGPYVLTAMAIDTEGGFTNSSGVAVTVNPLGSATLASTADAHVRNGSNANTNYGTNSSLEVATSSTSGNSRDAYLKFDLTSVPAVTVAKLRIYASLTAAGSYGLSAYGVTNTTWIESGTGGITWNTKPALGPVQASATISGTTYAWYEIVVTSYVQAEKAASRNVITLGLNCPTTTTLVIQGNSRNATVSGPELVVTSSTSPAPSIATVLPNSGPINSPVTITGTNFKAVQGTSTIKFNGVSATPSSWSDTSINVSVPVSATTGPVTVTVDGVASNSVTFTVAGNASDTDGDSLPDSWEVQYFSNLSQSASGDPDGDGRNNLTEYLQGRDPTKGTVADVSGLVNLIVHTILELFQ